MRIVPGMILEFTRDLDFSVKGEVVASYDSSDRILVGEPTLDNPYGHIARPPYYWVTTKNGSSIWTSLPILLERKILRLVE